MERGNLVHSSARGKSKNNMQVMTQAWINENRAAALSHVSADTVTVIVRVPQGANSFRCQVNR
jgi:hypothetical protein